MPTIRLTTIAGGITGLALLVWLLVNEGLGNIFTILSLVGLNIIWVAIYRVVPIGLDALGWGQLFKVDKKPCFSDLVNARWVAESVNTLFPVGQVGGHIIRARILKKKSATDNESGATVMVDFTIGLSTQILFTILGLVLLLPQTGQEFSSTSIFNGIVVALLVVGCFFFSQKVGLFGLLTKFANRLIQRKKTTDLIDSAQNFDQQIRRVYDRKKQLFPCFFWRLGGWIAKSGEIWLFFVFIGSPISIQDAIIMESISTAFRSAAFFIPGGLGVQDGSLLFIGSLLGFDPNTILALALVKRFRELIVGIPGILWWYREERQHRNPHQAKD